MRRRAFTLVETLVVVSVVALLLGVLLPTLRGSMRAAHSAACASNIRQLQIANLRYAGDHDERFVAGAPRHVSQNLARWHGVRTNASGPFSSEGAPLTRYLEGGPTSDALRVCPSFARTSPAVADTIDQGAFERSAGGYVYNNAFVGVERHLASNGIWNVTTDEVGSRQSWFRHPARTMAFADGAYAGDVGVIEYSFLEPRFWPHIPDARPDPSTHFRHNGRANIVWLDGHVTSEPLTFTWSSGLTLTDPAKASIGWAGQDDDNSLYDYR